MEQLYRLQLWVRDVLVDHMDKASDGGFLTLAAILPLGLLFGALHAMTPGHSKTVLATYLLGSRNKFFKSIGVAGLLSITHVGMAVILAFVGMSLITKTLVGAGRAPSLETISRGIIICIGLWLCIRAVLQNKRHKHEGGAFGLFAGLIPCPLTLFVMFAALRRGTPEIGLLWAVAMAGGVMITLGLTAALSVLARNTVINLMARNSERSQYVSRLLEGLAGLTLIVLAAYELPI